MFFKKRQSIVWLTECACVLAALSGCGQKGLLYLPTEPAAQGRATLPQVLSPALRASQAERAASPLSPASNASSSPR